MVLFLALREENSKSAEAYHPSKGLRGESFHSALRADEDGVEAETSWKHTLRGQD
jgi:hypothetical protein